MPLGKGGPCEREGETWAPP